MIFLFVNLAILISLFLLTCVLFCVESRLRWSIPFQREVVINASRDHVYALLSNPQQWEAWLIYPRLAPYTAVSIDKTPEGKGVIYRTHFSEATITILQDNASAHLIVKIVLFWGPFQQGEQTAVWKLSARGEATQFTWTSDGSHPSLWHVVNRFFNTDKWIARSIEKALSDLQHAVEKSDYALVNRDR